MSQLAGVLSYQIARQRVFDSIHVEIEGSITLLYKQLAASVAYHGLASHHESQDPECTA